MLLVATGHQLDATDFYQHVAHTACSAAYTEILKHDSYISSTMPSATV